MSYGPIVDKVAGAIQKPASPKPIMVKDPSVPSLMGQGSAARQDSLDKAARNANNPWSLGE